MLYSCAAYDVLRTSPHYADDVKNAHDASRMQINIELIHPFVQLNEHERSTFQHFNKEISKYTY